MAERLSLLDRAAVWLMQKAASTAPLPRPSLAQPQGLDWFRPDVRDPSPRALIEEGYRTNSAVFACVNKLATGFAEPPLRVCGRNPDGTPGKTLPNHPLQRLLDQPVTQVLADGTRMNLMGQDEWLTALAIYRAVGGNAYIYKQRDPTGRPASLWPYHSANIAPVPSGTAWIDHFAYDVGADRDPLILAPRDVVHWKWGIDPKTPWLGFPPLRAVAQETDSDNELTRYLFALLKNDAVPRGVLQMPAGVVMSDADFARFKDRWKASFSGTKRGDVAVLEGGLTYSRVGLNLQELAFDALRGVPEARIAASFDVPAMIAGLNIGLARSTYSNYEEARLAFTEEKLVQDWHGLESELNADLVPDFDDPARVMIAFDLTRVTALRNKAVEAQRWTLAAVAGGVLTINEGRAEFGKDPRPEGDRLLAPPAAIAGEALTSPPKQRAAKAAPTERERLENHLAHLVTQRLTATYHAVADHVEAD